ncbi:2OG-Fe(II) oxygenase [Halothece sp. PCC 7418]|uniref:prolyl hydroxylase family protein n=1 Tax=Halothece sp. (strain PCC 7418) TaxID=65093 RepID=UPI0002A07739|nr:2OG-Fe(II) oxygenase [Halothece sp. PCC 7418]AFZ42477.1 2OG-Fe(II) oxygenase [Halothece sp. PCC 7418]
MQHSYSLTPLGHEIYLVEQLLEPFLCQHLIQVTEHCQLQEAAIGVQEIDSDVRKNSYLKLGGFDSLLQSTNQLLMNKIKIIQDLLFQHYGLEFPYTEACTILRYQAGEFYQRHVDNLLLTNRFEEVKQGIPTRDISVVGYLNHGFEGGETYFDRQQIKVTPEEGSVLIFPSYYTHPHASLPIHRGVKYAFTSWLFH